MVAASFEAKPRAVCIYRSGSGSTFKFKMNTTELFVWGSDSCGQLVLAPAAILEKCLTSPRKISTDSSISDIACGEDFTLLLTGTNMSP